MSTQLSAACPRCHRKLQIDVPDDEGPPTTLLVKCDHCGLDKRLSSFVAEWERKQRHQRKEAARVTQIRREMGEAAGAAEAERWREEKARKLREAQELAEANRQRAKAETEAAEEAAPPNYAQHKQIISLLEQGHSLLISIRSMLLFFTVLAVIGLCLGLIGVCIPMR